MSRRKNYSQNAKQNKNKKNWQVEQENTVKNEEVFKNPANTHWGRWIIVILALLMGFGSLISIIILAINNR